MLKLSYFACLWLAATLFISFSAASLFHLFILASGGYFVWQAIKTKELNFSKSTLALIGLVLVSILSLLVNGGPYKHMTKLKYFILGIFSIYSFQAIVKNYFNEKRIKIFATTFLVSSALASLSGIIGLMTGFNPLRFKAACHLERACGMYGMYMSYGYGMGYFILVSVLLLINRKKIFNFTHPVILFGSNIINFMGFYLSYARGALIAFFVGGFVYLLKKKLKLALVFIGSSLLAGILLFNFNASFNSMFTNRGSSTDQRLSLYQAAFFAFKDKPLLGLGYRNFENQSVQIKKDHNLPQLDFAGTAHNNFLEHLASTGILGFLCMVLFHLFWAYEMWKRDDLIGQIGLAFISSLFISGQVEYTLGDGETLFFIMFVYAWTQIPKKYLTIKS